MTKAKRRGMRRGRGRVVALPTPNIGTLGAIPPAPAEHTLAHVASLGVIGGPPAPEPVLYADDVVALFKGKVARVTIIKKFLRDKAKRAGKYKYWLASDVHAAIASGETGLGASRSA